MCRLLPSDFGCARQIVITGIGLVSPVGRSVGQFWNSLTGSAPDAAETADLESGQPFFGVADFGGQMSDFVDLPPVIRKSIRKALKLMNRETQMGVAAGQQALVDSGLTKHHDPERIGVCFGADNFSVMPEDFLDGIQACSNAEGEFEDDRWGTEGIPEIAPLWLLKCLPNMPACHLAIINDLRGPSNTITQRDISANMAIAEACRAIKSGDVDAMLVGATGTTLSPLNEMHARLENEVSAGGNEIGRPFNRRHRGASPGEGAGAIILEELGSALQRKAHIFGEVLGTASTSCVGRDSTEGCRQALANAMRQTLDRANLTPDRIGHIHAHGLGTTASDVAEAQAIRDVFGSEVSRPPIVAAKSHLANAGAGSGALELIASLLALEHGHLFPTLNEGSPDPNRPLRPVTKHGESAGTSFLNLSTFGRGLASCAAIGACLL